MAFVFDINRKVCVLRLRGAEVSKVRGLAEAVSSIAQKSPFIVFDLDNERLTSLGIGMLLNVSNTYRDVWTDNFVPINIYNIHPQVRQLLEVSGLDNSFRVWNSLDDCYKSLGDHPAQ